MADLAGRDPIRITNGATPRERLRGEENVRAGLERMKRIN